MKSLRILSVSALILSSIGFSNDVFADIEIVFMQAAKQPNGEVVREILTSRDSQNISKPILIRTLLEAKNALTNVQQQQNALYKKYKGQELKNKIGALGDEIQQYKSIIDMVEEYLTIEEHLSEKELLKTAINDASFDGVQDIISKNPKLAAEKLSFMGVTPLQFVGENMETLKPASDLTIKEWQKNKIGQYNEIIAYLTESGADQKDLDKYPYAQQQYERRRYGM